MNQEEQNRVSASFYRQIFLIKMLSLEHEHFLKTAKHSGIKNVLFRLKNSVAGGLDQLLSYLPNSRETFKTVMQQNDEKIIAMLSIIEKISMLDEETVLQLEKDFDEQVKIQY